MGAMLAVCTSVSLATLVTKLTAPVLLNICAWMTASAKWAMKSSRAFCSASVVLVTFAPLSNPQGALCNGNTCLEAYPCLRTFGGNLQPYKHFLQNYQMSGMWPHKQSSRIINLVIWDA